MLCGAEVGARASRAFISYMYCLCYHLKRDSIARVRLFSTRFRATPVRALHSYKNNACKCKERTHREETHNSTLYVVRWCTYVYVCAGTCRRQATNTTTRSQSRCKHIRIRDCGEPEQGDNVFGKQLLHVHG